MPKHTPPRAPGSKELAWEYPQAGIVMEPGDLVMSHDAGRKMIAMVAVPHGPWIFERIQKGGLIQIRNPETGEVRSVPRRLLTLHGL